MALAPGEQVGPYEIVSRLGAGGMGVVYRARDTHLQRTVALKVLTEGRGISGTSDRLLQEARTISALNHPNVCTVHEIREEAGHIFIVMEYVDGRPLQEQIPINGLPADSLLRYAVQLADGLAHAHDRGVLHRDLKSANVMITREGRTKIVDFGLASRLAVGAYEDTRSNSPLPGDSALAGTLAYMAPEVIHGDQPSPVSDLWSVGVLLYEMATGHLPFSGRTMFEVTAAILREPPAPLPTRIPPSLRTIIARCLTKEPAQRYQTARELRAALEAVQSDVSTVPVQARVRPPQLIDWRIVTAAGGVAILLIIAAWRIARDPAPAAPAGSGRLVRVLSSDREASDPALSPDGTMIAYVAEDDAGRTDLFVSRVAGGGGRVRLTDDDTRETHPRFSPDGERIVFSRRGANGIPHICFVPALGGQVSEIVQGGGHPVWAPDGLRIAFIRYAEGGKRLILATARTDGTDVRDLLPAEGASPFIRGPAWSPDGRLIAFISGAGGVAGEIWLVNADGGGTPKRLSADSASVSSDAPVFSADGRAIVHESNRGGATNIWALPVAGGPAVRLTSGAGPDRSPTVDSRGRVAFISSRWRNDLIVYDMRTAQTRSLVRHTPFLWAPALAPVKAEVAFSRGEVDGSWHIWTANLDGTSPHQLTNTERGEVYPRWTPDGRSVLFQDWAAPRRIWRVPREGGPLSPLTPSTIDAGYGDLSPDGRQLAFAATDGAEERAYVMPVVAGGTPRLLRSGPASVPRWSPDGAWIAFAPDRGYFGGISIVRPDGTGERRLTDTGGWPVWWPDGRRIGYTTIRGDLTQQVQTITLDGPPKVQLVPIRFAGTNEPFDISRDGQVLATTSSVHVSSEIWVLDANP
jgi:eukaryotic-like serine/threonine-protein kinase